MTIRIDVGGVELIWDRKYDFFQGREREEGKGQNERDRKKSECGLCAVKIFFFFFFSVHITLEIEMELKSCRKSNLRPKPSFRRSMIPEANIITFFPPLFFFSFSRKYKMCIYTGLYRMQPRGGRPFFFLIERWEKSTIEQRRRIFFSSFFPALGAKRLIVPYIYSGK